MKKLLHTVLPLLLLWLLLLTVGCEDSSCDHESGVKTVVEPTCEKDGYTLYQCNDCEFSETASIIPASGHSMQETVIAPTCEGEGYTLNTCANCSLQYNTNVKKPTGHDLRGTTTSPTCEEEGYTDLKCANCDLEYSTDIVPPKGHTLKETIVPPTCTEEGYTQVVCDECDYEYKTDAIAPKGHTLTAIVTKPTCTKEGFTLYTCACKYSFTADAVAPVGHTYTSEVIEPTCTDGGYTVKTCTVCKHSLRTDFTDPLEHDNEIREIAPTCSLPGYTQHLCTRCTYTYRTKYLSPLGHTFTMSIAHPTRTSAGSLLHSCACGYERRDPLFYSDIFTGAYAEHNEPLAKGVDVSEYQHAQENGEWLPLNWTSVRNAGFDFAILKVGSTPRISSSGSAAGGVSPTFEMDYRDAKDAGVQLGAYFYTYATTAAEALADANRLISWLGNKQFEYPIYLDLEDPSQADLGKDVLTEICTTFLSALQEKGYYAALYTNNDWLINRLHKDILLPLYDIWYARPPLATDTPIPPEQTFQWSTEKYGDHLGMWQYTHHGMIEGIEGMEFDFNYVYRDYPTIIKKYGYNGFFIE